MIYCLNPACPHPQNPADNVHCQYCGVLIALRNRFKAERLLGQGGFGKTYLARDLDNRNKPCVIKRLTYQGPDQQSTDKARQLFEQEAERLDQLVHPQIPRLLAYFQEGRNLYLVQEIIEGQTLQEELQANGPFTEAKIKGVLKGLLPVLEFVHSRNVIHRDIKPDNIMRRRSGELILIDFGVAKFLEESGFSNSATTIGTPGYAAPEQIQGRVTPASDLFGLGATCFELLSQCFDSDDISMTGYSWVKHWRKHVKLPISDGLAAILTQMLDINERQRYSTAAAVTADLANLSKRVSASPQPQPQWASPPNELSQLPTIAAAPLPPPTGGAPLPAGSAPQGFISPPASPPSGPRRSLPTDLSLKTGSSGNRPINGPAAGVSGGYSSGGSYNSSGSYNSGPEHNIVGSYNSGGGYSSSGGIRQLPVSFFFWLKYGLLSYVGQGTGFIAAMIVTVIFVAALHPDPGNLSAADEVAVQQLLFWMHWVVGGFFVGLAQWFALKRWVPKALWWVPATVTGFWAIALAVSTNYVGMLTGIVIGLLLGLAQWGVMRKYAPRAGWWVLWCMVFTALLCYAITTDMVNTVGWFLFVPLLDGMALTWILREQVETP
ncbi:MAG: serine/threonine-protein kinase [Cyanobacteria bacterium J06581_3]